MRKPRKRSLLFAACCGLLLLALILRIHQINKNSYSFSEKLYPVGEWVPLEGDFFFSAEEGTDHYSVRVSSAQALPYAAFMAKFEKQEDYLAESSQHDVVLLQVDFKNEGADPGGVFIRDFNLLNEYQSAYYNKSEDYMRIANPGLDVSQFGISLRPGTESSLWFVYTTVGRADQVTYLEEQKGRDHVTMFLNVSLYPVKKQIRLELDLSALS